MSRAWSQADLDDYAAWAARPSEPSPPPVTLDDVLTELDQPAWYRAMDPRDREWLDRVNGPLHG